MVYPPEDLNRAAVHAAPARRKGIGTRLWLVVSESGKSHVEEVGKHSIMRRTGLPARDLRVLDPMLSYPSTILGRERAIVVNLEHIKAIITAAEILMINSTNPLVVQFVIDLQDRVSTPSDRSNSPLERLEGDLQDKNHAALASNFNRDDPNATVLSPAGGGPKILPFEFKALEVCLESACRCLESETQTLEDEAYPALDELTSQISTLNLERVRQIKSRLVAISGRVQKVRDELEHLLDDDNDMAEMYLTEKLVESSREQASLREESGIEEVQVDDQRYEESEAEHSENNSDISTVFKPNIEELESLLEAYFAQIDGISQKLANMNEYVDDTEDFINIMLDDKQNQLLQMGVMLSTGNMILNAGIVVVGLFGMNIYIELYKGPPKQFWETVSGTVGGCLALYLIAIGWASTSNGEYPKAFMQCLISHSNNSTSMSELIYTPKNSSYAPILQVSINNLRFMTAKTPKPLVIVTPVEESQVQTIIFCSKKFDMHVRVRSGGHDFEGQSYVARVPFVLLDMTNLRTVLVNVTDGTAWVESGATIGELYCGIAEKSGALGFPAGLWTNVGIGGFISGGGYGMMTRKYGLAADNVIDARFVNVNGTILSRETMGEDLFWAIRGGGGSSFGVVLSWTIKLVSVPEIVTVFRIVRTSEENAADIFHRWQEVAPRFPKDLDLKCYVQSIVSNSSTRQDKRTIRITFESLYLGPRDSLLALIRERFPELGLEAEDCSEMSWIESGPFFSNHTAGTSPDIMLNRTALPKFNFKGKSDFARNLIPREAIKGMWEMLFSVAPEAALLQFTPYGGRMNEIPESAIPFPHRAGTLYMIYIGVFLEKDASQRLKWMDSLYEYLRPYVSKNPRAAYVNYLDLDLGNNTSSSWGKRYFKSNFRRLMQVKTVADPENFFWHEQSIPTLPA
ncbi:hypothetical protein ACET3Z_024156 [Daucus carota]